MNTEQTSKNIFTYNYIDDEIIDEDSDSDYDTVDSHLNFSVPDSYVEI